MTQPGAEEWTECQMYGHDFKDGCCTRCPEVDERARLDGSPTGRLRRSVPPLQGLH